MHQILAQGRVDRLRVLLGLQPLLVNPDQFLAPAGILAKHIVGDAVKPGRKLGLPAKAADVLVSPEESFLRQIISQREIGPGKLAKQTSHGRLMPPDQLTEGVLVVLDKNTSEEVRIS